MLFLFCYFSFVLFVFVLCLFCVCFVFVCACFFQFLMKITVSPAIRVFLKREYLFLISVAGSCFLFYVVCSLFQDVLWFLFICLFSCFVLNHNIRFVFALRLLLLLVLFCFVGFVFCFLLPIKNISEKMEIPKTPEIKNEENRHFDKSN